MRQHLGVWGGSPSGCRAEPCRPPRAGAPQGQADCAVRHKMRPAAQKQHNKQLGRQLEIPQILILPWMPVPDLQLYKLQVDFVRGVSKRCRYVGIFVNHIQLPRYCRDQRVLARQVAVAQHNPRRVCTQVTIAANRRGQRIRRQRNPKRRQQHRLPATGLALAHLVPKPP